jgi:hypothetical protein
VQRKDASDCLEDYFPSLKPHPQFKRQDLKEHVFWYIDMAYETLGVPTYSDRKLRNPFQTLRVLRDFWDLVARQQDTIVVCLEVQQRFLYVGMRRRLMEWIEQLKSLQREFQDSNN